MTKSEFYRQIPEVHPGDVFKVTDSDGVEMLMRIKCDGDCESPRHRRNVSVMASVAVTPRDMGMTDVRQPPDDFLLERVCDCVRYGDIVPTDVIDYFLSGGSNTVKLRFNPAYGDWAFMRYDVYSDYGDWETEFVFGKDKFATNKKQAAIMLLELADMRDICDFLRESDCVLYSRLGGHNKLSEEYFTEADAVFHITKKRVLAKNVEENEDKWKEIALHHLQLEANDYNTYRHGFVYMYKLYNIDDVELENEICSVGGFYSDNSRDSGIFEDFVDIERTVNGGLDCD